MEKRKTKTSYEVKRRYDTKTYNLYTIKLRRDQDASLIEFIEGNKSIGLSPADTIRKLFQNQ